MTRFEKIILSNRKVSLCVVVILFVLFVGTIYKCVDNQMTINAHHRELEAEWLNVQHKYLKLESNDSEEYNRLVARSNVLSDQLYAGLLRKFLNVTELVTIAFTLLAGAALIGSVLIDNTKK